MTVEYIDAYRGGLGVGPICRVLTEQAGVQVAPSTYYAAKQQGPVSAADLDDTYDANTLFDLWVANRGVYGVRKLWHAVKRAGHGWGRDRVARLMRIAGINGLALTAWYVASAAPAQPSATSPRRRGVPT